MIFYITLLRALASILITNAHYTGVYPIELIANGGLLGDVLFFAISGFCLYNIKDKFSKWYSKRIFRIYPAVWIITLIYLMIGFYTLYYFLKCFAGINSKLEKLPNKIKNVIKFLSSITLEIYIVQYPIIPIFKNLVFPINWLAITITILIVAYILHIVSKQVINFIERIVLNENTNNRSSKI